MTTEPPSEPPTESQRPAPEKRTFVSAELEKLIAEVSRDIVDERLRRLFVNCLPNALDTAVKAADGQGQDTFVVSGDIPAMWLRDSAAELWPYLELVRRDEALRLLVAGLVRRQARSVLLDPYANAYNLGADGPRHGEEYTEVSPGVWERKWELDSLCYVVRLAHGYWKAAGVADVFDETWDKAARLVVGTMREQQRIDVMGPYVYKHPEVAHDGLGTETRSNGLIHSIYRPSDDVTRYPMLIPSNIMAVVALEQLAEIYGEVYHEALFARECGAMADQVREAVVQHAVIDTPDFGRVFAYEVDGRGNANLMDDANVPSLLSLPYFDPAFLTNSIYRATRRMVLSGANPSFHRGSRVAGIGSPHTAPGSVWPMSIIMQALTSRDEEEIRGCLGWLVAAGEETGFMHESVNPDNPGEFTRPWFAWANSLFGELILWVHKEHPNVLKDPVS